MELHHSGTCFYLSCMLVKTKPTAEWLEHSRLNPEVRRFDTRVWRSKRPPSRPQIRDHLSQPMSEIIAWELRKSKAAREGNWPHPHS